MAKAGAAAESSGRRRRSADFATDVVARSDQWGLLGFETETTVPDRKLSAEDTTAPDDLATGTGGDAGTTDDAGAGFACTASDLLESASFSSMWRQYCSSLTTGAKSFAMSLDCQLAAFSNVSGSDTTESNAEAVDNCSDASTDCAVFDEGGAQCQSDTLTHIMHINVQMYATDFRYDSRSVDAVNSAMASIYAGIEAADFTSVLELYTCEDSADDECPTPAPSAADSTTVEDADAAQTTEDPNRRLEDGEERLDTERFIEDEGDNTVNWPSGRPRRPPHAGAAGRWLTGAATTSEEPPPSSDGAAATTTAEAPPSSTDEDGTTTDDSASSMPDDYAPSDGYDCVSSCRASECPVSFDIDNCTGDAGATRRLSWAPRPRRAGGALRARGAGPEAQPAAAADKGAVGEGDARFIATSAVGTLLEASGGRRLSAVGESGARVIATSTVETLEADVFNWKAEHAGMGASGVVWYLDASLQTYMQSVGMPVEARRLSSSISHGVVEVVQASVVGADGASVASLAEEEDEMSGLALALILVAVLLCVAAAVAIACYCSARAKKRRATSDGLPKVAAPNLEVFKMSDPRDGMQWRELAVVGFGREVNPSCNAAFLENDFVVPRGEALKVQAPADEQVREFDTASAALSALPFWSRVGEFEKLSAEEARGRAQDLLGTEDTIHRMGGFTPIGGLRAVLEAKFCKDTSMAQALLSTGDSFLVCHAAEEVASSILPSRSISSAGGDECVNWLGMLLMIIRDEISPVQAHPSWSDFIKDNVNVDTGRPKGTKKGWQRAVLAARAALAGEPPPAEEPEEAAAPPPLPPAEPLPPPAEEVVPFSMQVGGVDYDRLVSDSSLKASFEDEVRSTLAQQVGGGVQRDRVKVVLSSGSVLVDAEIPLPSGVPASGVHSDLRAGSRAMEAGLASRIEDLPGIQGAQNGQISVSCLRAYPAKQALEDSTPFLNSARGFLPPLPLDSPAGTRAASWPPAARIPPPGARSLSPDYTNRGNKIPLTYRGGNATVKT